MDAPEAVPITAVIAAGGESSRFGQDKASFRWRGRPMADRALATVRQVVTDVRVGLPAPESRPRLSKRYPVVEDDPAGIGPMGCLRGAMKAAPGRAILLVACDMPLLRASAVQALVTTYRVQAPARIVAAESEANTPEPLLAVYPPDILGAIEQSIRSSRFALWRLLRELGYVPVRVDLDQLTNVNSPADLPGESGIS